MTFWLFSGCDQKSGALICSSVLFNCDRREGASKIAPHSVSLLAERYVFAFQFFERHTDSFYQRMSVACQYRVHQHAGVVLGAFGGHRRTSSGQFVSMRSRV
jgi:hypothetical protein